MDPSTGYPADSGVISVTIVVDSNLPDSNMMADVLTKTIFVLGVDNGLKFIDNIQGISCMAITSDYKIYKSSSSNIKVDKLDSEFKMAN